MPIELVGVLIVVLMMVLITVGMRIGYATLLVAILGFALAKGWGVATGMAGILAFSQIASWEYFVIPMFILMGYFLAEAGLADEIFTAAEKWVGHLPGGLALTVVFGNAAFAACTGSTAAACAVSGKILIPKMRKIGYSDALSSGVVAAAGCFAMLIPPSTMVVIYGIVTETSIGAVLIGGILPGILSAVVYAIYLYILCKRNPEAGPTIPAVSWRERFRGLSGIWVVFFVIALMLGGLYLGIFTPTEGGAVGAIGIFFVCLARRRITWKVLKTSLSETANLSCMVLVLMLGILTLMNFMSLSGLTADILNWIGRSVTDRWLFFALIMVLYILLGMFIGSIGMMVLTLPVVFPVMVDMGFNPVWFGIIVMIMGELGCITPPIGFNVFVVGSVCPDIPLLTIYRGCIPFMLLDLLIVAIVTVFPQIITWLPSMMKMG